VLHSPAEVRPPERDVAKEHACPHQ
jgi:hypothetical protein